MNEHKHNVQGFFAMLQDLAGLRMNMLNQNTMKVFKSMAGIYQDHYPVSHLLYPHPIPLSLLIAHVVVRAVATPNRRRHK